MITTIMRLKGQPRTVVHNLGLYFCATKLREKVAYIIHSLPFFSAVLQLIQLQYLEIHYLYF